MSSSSLHSLTSRKINETFQGLETGMRERGRGEQENCGAQNEDCFQFLLGAVRPAVVGTS